MESSIRHSYTYPYPSLPRTARNKMVVQSDDIAHGPSATNRRAISYTLPWPPGDRFCLCRSATARCGLAAGRRKIRVRLEHSVRSRLQETLHPSFALVIHGQASRFGEAAPFPIPLSELPEERKGDLPSQRRDVNSVRKTRLYTCAGMVARFFPGEIMYKVHTIKHCKLQCL